MDEYEVYDLADYIITKANKLDKAVNNFQLQLLLYLINLQSIKQYHQQLSQGIKFTQTDYGPQIFFLFNEYKNHLGNPITKPEKHPMIHHNPNGMFWAEWYQNHPISYKQKQLIDSQLPKLLTIDKHDLIDHLNKLETLTY